MRALTSVLESDEVGQAQVCRAPPEERLASSRAQAAASVWTQQNAFTRQWGQPSAVQCYDFLFQFCLFFFYNFVTSSSVVSVEDHQQTFRSNPMRVLRLHQILSVSELMDGRSCRRAGRPISTGGLDTWSSSAVFLSLSWLLRPLPSRRTVSWDSALVPALAGRGGEAAWTAAQLPCRSRSLQQMHLDEPSHMDVVVPLWLKRCQVSIKTRCVRLNIGFFFSFFVTRWTSFILFILFFRKVPTVFHIWMILRHWIKNTRGGCRCQEAAFIFQKKKQTPACSGVFAVWCSAANRSPKLR